MPVDGVGDALSCMIPVNPFSAVAEMPTVLSCPEIAVTVGVSLARRKSWKTNVILVVCVADGTLPVPVTETVNVPNAVAVHDRVEGPPAGSETVAGFRVRQFRPALGEIEVTDRLTEPLDVLPALTDTVDVAVAPAKAVTELGLAVRKKSVEERTVTATTEV
jgi:hypothetical protein